MDINTVNKLERQSWMLFIRLRWVLEHDYTAPTTRRKRLSSLMHHAYIRWERRQSLLFDYRPEGFALPSARPSAF